jgi:hypothetical protein
LFLANAAAKVDPVQRYPVGSSLWVTPNSGARMDTAEHTEISGRSLLAKLIAFRNDR